MIQQPSFPQKFTKFLAVILQKQLEADQLKAQIDLSSAKEIFNLIGSKYIYVEDFYSFLKKNNVQLTKKELKFVNRYFGFNSHQKLDIEEFIKYFLNSKDPKNKSIPKSNKPLECFVTYIRHIIQSYNQIQSLRIQLASNLDQIKSCLKEFYQEKPQSITCQLIKEVLFYKGIYSRLNVTLLSHYIIGEDDKEVTLRQLFWTQNQQVAQPKAQSTLKTAEEIVFLRQSQVQFPKISKSPQLKPTETKSSDILWQIQNIEVQIRRKKDEYIQRKHILQQQMAVSKPIGSLVKKNSFKSLISNQTTSQSSKMSIPSRFKAEKQNINDKPSFEVQTKMIKKSSQKEKDQFELSSFMEQEFAVKNTKINELLKSRMSNKVRQQVLSKASSHAKLKIQEIERRVMSKFGQRPSQSKEFDEMPRKISQISQLQSRNSSLSRH